MARQNKRNRRGKAPRDTKGYGNRYSREEERSGSTDGRNDISWYSRYPNLLVAAGSFPYPYRPGMQLPLGTTSITSAGGKTYSQDVSLDIPGVLTMDWIPSVGKSSTATDPASIVAKEIYAKVRQVYSGSLNADAPDFVVYLMALDSIFSYIAWLKRLYRVMNAWSPENYILPDVVLEAMGLSYADIQSLRVQKTELWQIINELVLQSRKFTCPAIMDIFNRHYWMSDNVYTDEATINSQFYMFNLRAVYQFAMLNMPDGNPGPGLQMVPMPYYGWKGDQLSVVLTPKTLYEFGRGLIDALVEWDDAYEINGYLSRAYEGTPNFIVDELPQDQPFNPVYVPEVLSQIENSRVVPGGMYIGNGVDAAHQGAQAFAGFNVTQNVLTNAIISSPSYAISVYQDIETGSSLANNAYSLKPTLSVRSVSPTVADSVIATRLQAAVKNVTKSGSGDIHRTYWNASVDAGTEIPLCWRLQDRLFTAGTRQTVYQSGNVPQTSTLLYDLEKSTASEVHTMMAAVLSLHRLEQFDWHPFCFILAWTIADSQGEGVGFASLYVNGDTHNITTISNADLENLHKICLYSELNAFSA